MNNLFNALGLRDKVNKALDICWKKVKELEETDPVAANQLRAEGFELLEQLPENKQYLELRQ